MESNGVQTAQVAVRGSAQEETEEQRRARYDEIIKTNEENMQYRNLLNLFGHLAQKVALLAKKDEDIDWTEIAHTMKGHFHVEADSPWVHLFHSSGKHLKIMYEKLWENHKELANSVRNHRDYQDASDAKCLEIVMVTKFTQWDRLEREEGKRDYFHGCKLFFRDAIGKNASKSVIADKIRELTPVLEDFFKNNLQDKFKDIVKIYFPYFKEVYYRFEFEVPEPLKYVSSQDRTLPIQSQNISSSNVIDRITEQFPAAIVVASTKECEKESATGNSPLAVKTSAPVNQVPEIPVPSDPVEIPPDSKTKAAPAAAENMKSEQVSSSMPSASAIQFPDEVAKEKSVGPSVPPAANSGLQETTESHLPKEVKVEPPSSVSASVGSDQTNLPLKRSVRPGLPSVLPGSLSVVRKPPRAATVVGFNTIFSKAEGREVAYPDLAGSPSKDTTASAGSQASTDAKEPDQKKKKSHTKAEIIPPSSKGISEELRWKNFENMCSAHGKLGVDEIAGIKKGLLVSLYSVPPNDIIDYDPFKLPVSDFTATRYDEYIMNPKSIETLLSDPAEDKGTPNVDLTELMLIPLNALVFNSFPSEILNGSVDLLAFLNKYQQDVLGKVPNDNATSSDFDLIMDEMRRTAGSEGYQRPPMDQQRPIVLQEAKTMRRGPGAVAAAKSTIQSSNNPRVGRKRK